MEGLDHLIGLLVFDPLCVELFLQFIVFLFELLVLFF